MDSGVNIFASYLRKYLHRFKRIKIGVDLAIGHTGSFGGYGIMLLSTPVAPNFLFACYPTFLAPRDTCCTVSNGAFLKYAGFTKVLLDTWCEAHFEHKSGAKFTLPLVPNNLIDYISFDVLSSCQATAEVREQQSRSAAGRDQPSDSTRVVGSIMGPPYSLWPSFPGHSSADDRRWLDFGPWDTQEVGSHSISMWDLRRIGRHKATVWTSRRQHKGARGRYVAH